MPERPAVVSYAAGASLAAVALIYVFGPTFTIDNDNANSKKRTIVGLQNPANDCFINSVLQALAGLADLRIYLIRETHRRSIENPDVYAHLVQPNGTQSLPQWKLEGLQEGLVTQGLKDMLDALNERPIARKSISPLKFVRVLEFAFKQKISRQQQDAQEFLQIVAERLKDEYHAGQRARSYARRLGVTPSAEALAGDDASDTNSKNTEKKPEDAVASSTGPENESSPSETPSAPATSTETITAPLELEDGFPMEGQYESHLECQTCRYRTKPRQETFCSITLAVPQVNSTSLSACFDGIFKTEYIDEFKCEMCRLTQTTANLEHELTRSTSETFKKATQEKIAKLRMVMETDPENPPDDVELGDIRYAPKRKIAKTTRMTVFPKILAIHLSRSIFGSSMTQKNMARVSFPEQLPMGGLASQHQYKLLGMVSHKGGHNSGHYEAFRRQNLPTPHHHFNTFQKSEAYSRTPTPQATPEMSAQVAASPAISTPDLLSGSSGDTSPARSVESLPAPPRSVPEPSLSQLPPPSPVKEKDPETNSLRSVAASTKSVLSKLASPRNGADSPGRQSPPIPGVAPQKSAAHRKPPKKRKSDKWWRVSDEKVREAKTSEVLGMQKEVYLLFYELERD